VNKAELDKIYDQPFLSLAGDRVKHDTLSAGIRTLAELFNALVTDEWTDEVGMFHEKLQEVSYWGHMHIIRNE
jgi:hypothetical protein